ncbi:GAF domain-containing protein [Phormidium sp. CLA17]|uniref:GAF domain-containing protein n=1 Tax=Leptolyngbya sp. Cla-17 TaxID=2803751 RepID=UPI0014929EF4|nr:GAF domain-containing protein [Leptolyngbya sp. Cla-17]MBM0742541.1 GAF domain-containing protein [Leptolyngbya sp. Cla-17]
MNHDPSANQRLNIGSHTPSIGESSALIEQPLLPSVTKFYAAPLDLAQRLYQYFPTAVFVKAGQKDGEITFWNKQAELLLGLSAEQTIGKTLYDFLPLPLAKRMEACDRAVLQQGVQTTVEETIEYPAEKHKILQILRVPLVEENQPPCVLYVIEDITERKQAEAIRQQQAEQTQQLTQIASQIRESLDLKRILTVYVNGVRDFLQTDRVVVLRFRPNWSGMVLTESIALGWNTLIGKTFDDPCFASRTNRYQQGQINAIADIHTANLTPCYFTFLETLQVRAILTLPILHQGKLWGLLVIHHCRASRLWAAFEIDCLKQLTSQVGKSIEQSETYQQVQRANAELERQVQIRTAELQLASEFEATLKRITDRVRDNLDEDKILQTAVRELAIGIGVTGCNAAIYDLENRTSKVSYEYTDSMVPLQGRTVIMDNFPEGYRQLLQGYYFQFCSLVPNPLRGHVAMLACPILDDQGVLGDLWLVSQKHRAFNDQDIRLVQQVANQCAIAIRQARLYQKAQAQVEALETLNLLKDDFLSTVSHELRTPISNIKLATQMLEINLESQHLLDNPSSPLGRYFQILKNECQREISLINDLLDLSRLETGADTPNWQTVDLAKWIPTLVQPFCERAHSQNQIFQLDLPPWLPFFITDSSRLERILSELLSNACKYTPTGETITLSVHLIQSEASALSKDSLQENSDAMFGKNWRVLPTTTTNDYGTGSAIVPSQPSLSFQISNSGVEISPEQLTRIFDKFYRIPNNDPWKHGGTGLGLALVKKLVEPLGGSIQVTSCDRLTRFVIELPLHQAIQFQATSPSNSD